MMKSSKIIAAVMTLTIVGGSTPFMADIAPDNALVAVAADYKEITEGDFTYKIYEDHAELTNFTSKTDDDVIIPAKVNGKAVTVIGDYVFYEKKDITNITIPDSVTKIGSNAFYNTGIRKIVLPSKLKTIGSFAFQSNKKLASVSIPAGTEKIENNAFAYCEVMTSVSLPNSLKVIGEKAFAGCKSLEEITYPSSIEEAGEDIFFNCTAIKKVTFEKGVTEIPDGIFYMDYSNSILDEINLPDGVKKIGKNAFYGTAIKKINIPSTVESIGDGAFWSCSKLGSVKIPNGISRIGKNTFRNCEVLTSVDLPSTIKYIDDSAFYVCGALEEIDLPEGIEEINDSAFNGTALKNVILPKSLEFLGSAFGGCKKLTSILFLNPNCSITQSDSTICNSTWAPLVGRKYEGVIYGYENSSAQKYAERFGYDFNLFNGENITDTTTSTTTTTTTKKATTTTTTTTTKAEGSTTSAKVSFTYPVITTENTETTTTKAELETTTTKAEPETTTTSAKASFTYPVTTTETTTKAEPETTTVLIPKTVTTTAEVPVTHEVTTTTTAAPASTAMFGDINGDGMIDARDATALLTYYAKASTGYDGTLLDFIIEQTGKNPLTNAPATKAESEK